MSVGTAFNRALYLPVDLISRFHFQSSSAGFCDLCRARNLDLMTDPFPLFSIQIFLFIYFFFGHKSFFQVLDLRAAHYGCFFLVSTGCKMYIFLRFPVSAAWGLCIFTSGLWTHQTWYITKRLSLSHNFLVFSGVFFSSVFHFYL